MLARSRLASTQEGERALSLCGERLQAVRCAPALRPHQSLELSDTPVYEPGIRASIEFANLSLAIVPRNPTPQGILARSRMASTQTGFNQTDARRLGCIMCSGWLEPKAARTLSLCGERLQAVRCAPALHPEREQFTSPERQQDMNRAREE
jgi:hypothetical protein